MNDINDEMNVELVARKDEAARCAEKKQRP
jgi:hypothetical protein